MFITSQRIVWVTGQVVIMPVELVLLEVGQEDGCARGESAKIDQTTRTVVTTLPVVANIGFRFCN